MKKRECLIPGLLVFTGKKGKEGYSLCILRKKTITSVCLKMRSKAYLVFLVIMLFGMIGVADGSSILYFRDYKLGTDRMAQALAGLPATDSVTIAVSSEDFETKILTGTFDLGIYFVQGYMSVDQADAITALGSFVSSGGKAIYTDWSMVNTYAALFGATWTGNYNQKSFVVTDPELALGITDPISLGYLEYNIYSMDVDGTTIAATFSDGHGAIVRSGNSIVNGFLSDTFANGSQGVQLYTNEINALLHPVPEPSTLLLLGAGLAGLAFARRRMR